MKSKFTTENAAMLLIDHQVGTIKLAKNIPHAETICSMRALARVAVETEFQGSLLDDLKTIAPEDYEKRVKRLGIVDAWEDANFKAAVVATGRKKLTRVVG